MWRDHTARAHAALGEFQDPQRRAFDCRSCGTHRGDDTASLMTFQPRPTGGGVVEPRITGGDLAGHGSEPILLVRIAGTPACPQVIEGRIQHGVHASDVDRCEPYRPGAEPRLPKIIVRCSQKVFRRHLHAIEINDMAARRPHAEWVPPRSVDWQVLDWRNGHLPAIWGGSRNQRESQSIDAACKVLFAAQSPFIERNRRSRRVSIPDTEERASSREGLESLALVWCAKHVDEKERVDMALEDSSNAEIAAPYGGKRAEQQSGILVFKRGGSGQSQPAQTVEGGQRERTMAVVHRRICACDRGKRFIGDPLTRFMRHGWHPRGRLSFRLAAQ